MVLLTAGVAPAQLVVSVSALAIPDVVRLARHAIDQGVDSLLLMPPCVYRERHHGGWHFSLLCHCH